MAHVKRAYTKPTWTEVQGPWSFFIGAFPPFPDSRSSRARMDREISNRLLPPLVPARSRVGQESRLMQHDPYPYGLAGRTYSSPFSP